MIRLHMPAMRAHSWWQHPYSNRARFQLNTARWHPLWKLIVYMWLGTGILALAAVGSGKVFSTARSASTVGLTWCDNLPCYRNLTPGRTRWTVNLTRFNSWPEDSTNPYQPSVFASADGNWLKTVIVPLSPELNVTAGDIVQLYGIPCRVDLSFYWKWSMVTLHYPGLHVQIGIARDRLSPDDPVQLIDLTDPTTFSTREQPDPCTSDVGSLMLAKASVVRRPWRGFTSLQRYLAIS